MNRSRTTAILLMLSVAFVGPIAAQPRGRQEPVERVEMDKKRLDLPRPTAHTERKIEGWTIRIDDDLLKPPHDGLGTRCLRFLESKLVDIKTVVPADKVKKLQAVTIELDLDYGDLKSMQYYPGADWLKEYGHSPNLAKCVHIPRAADLPTKRYTNEQPWFLLHELAHAYHDQVLGFGEPRIRKAYENYKKSGRGEKTVYFDGQRVEHYALANPMEFFAEMTEAYFGTNSYFPFNRGELKESEPEIYELLKKVWEAKSEGEKRLDLPRPTAHTERKIEGWTVRIDDRLLKSPDGELGTRCLRFLEAKLVDIKTVVPADKVKKLQAVTIELDLDYGDLKSMQYHPGAEWLKEHGHAANLAKCVHIPRAADLPTKRNTNEQPWVILHELAHAYHDQVLGFDEPRIREAYENYKKSGRGEKVLLFDGRRVKHYALTNPMEFFAEMTEAYLGTNDYYPFNRGELKESEPEIYALMNAVWEGKR